MCSPTALGPYCLFGVIVIDSCLVGGSKCSEISSHKRPRCLGERRRASVHVTSENCFWRATRARPHTLTVVLLLARACTWLHNHMPYFLCNLKSPFSLLISHSLYECAHAIHHKHTHTEHLAKHAPHVNPAWKLRRMDFICFNWTCAMATTSWLQAS